MLGSGPHIMNFSATKMIPQGYHMNASTFKCDEEITYSSEIELTAKWCILKPRIKGYKEV
jgi:hypothetical protein